MRFAHPLVLWLLLALPALGLLAYGRLRRAGRTLDGLLSPVMAERLTLHLRPGRRAAGLVLLLLAAFFLILGAARPQRGTQYVSATRRGIDIIIAMDVSESMLAEDLKPNRLVRARHEIAALLDRLKGDRVGLVAFAGAAFVQCPLTLDYSAARMFLGYMAPELIPEPGTNLAEALHVSVRGLAAEEEGFRALILISDGEDHMGGLDEAIAEARKENVRVFAVGIGDEGGEPIPMRDEQGQVEGYKKDREGKVVMTRLNEAPLRQIAEQTGGLYVRAAGSLGLDRVLAEIDAMEKKELQGGIRMLYEERYRYFVWPALLLLLAEWWIPLRRRARLPLTAWIAARRQGVGRAAVGIWVMALIGLAGATVAQTPQGAGGPPPGATPLSLGGAPAGAPPVAGAGLPQVEPGNPPSEEQLNEWLEENQVRRARDPGDPRPLYNLGTLLHYKNDLEQAQEYLGVASSWARGELGSRVAHNLGDTLYKLGRLKEARDAFARAAALDPANEDAKVNLELTQRALDQLQQQPDSSGQQQQQDQQDQQKQQGQKEKDQREQQEQKDKSGQQDQSQQQPENQQNQQDQQDQQNQQDQQSQQDRRDQQEQRPDRAQRPQSADQRPDSTLSPEQLQVQQILRGLEASERALLEHRFHSRSRNMRVEKDW